MPAPVTVEVEGMVVNVTRETLQIMKRYGMLSEEKWNALWREEAGEAGLRFSAAEKGKVPERPRIDLTKFTVGTSLMAKNKVKRPTSIPAPASSPSPAPSLSQAVCKHCHFGIDRKDFAALACCKIPSYCYSCFFENDPAGGIYAIQGIEGMYQCNICNMLTSDVIKIDKQ
jgi:hypothetical protein